MLKTFAKISTCLHRT